MQCAYEITSHHIVTMYYLLPHLQRSVDRGHGAHAAELQLHAGLRAAVGQRVELEPVPVPPAE